MIPEFHVRIVTKVHDEWPLAVQVWEQDDWLAYQQDSGPNSLLKPVLEIPCRHFFDAERIAVRLQDVHDALKARVSQQQVDEPD